MFLIDLINRDSFDVSEVFRDHKPNTDENNSLYCFTLLESI